MSSRTIFKNLRHLITIIVIIFYPVLAYTGIKHAGVRFASAVLIIVILFSTLLKIVTTKSLLLPVTLQAIAISIILSIGYIFKNPFYLKIIPSLIALTASANFFFSLLKTPLIESFARTITPDLSKDEIIYTRNVTIVWGFAMAFDSLICLIAALINDIEIWLILCFPVSYLLLGILFCSEYIVRKWKFGRFDESLIWDRMLKNIMKK